MSHAPMHHIIPILRDIRTGVFWRGIAAGCVMVILGACASTITTTEPNGTKTDIRVGFGNRVVRAPITIEPSENVIGAIERTAPVVIAKMSESVLNRAVDGATSAAR